MAWSPDGNSLYVALSGTQQVAHFRVDKATGLLTFQSNHPTAAQSPQSLAVDATGTVLACTNSGSTGIVSLYTLNPATGAPTVSGFASAAAGGTTGVVFSRDVH
jgi:6-phosphogluconolactonase (cycloisomerase 2 family)